MRFMLSLLLLVAVAGRAAPQSVQEQNKALARRFYEEVWFKPNLDVVDEIIAPTYIVHDIGSRRRVLGSATTV